MEPTLQIGDRLFVDKMSYGPELLPGIEKLPALSTPARNDIVVFESPQYVSRGPVFETLNRIVHMATLSLVTIDRDQNGEPRAQFLIKRVVGVPGDIVTFHKDTGAFLVRPHGESAAIDDRTLANNTHGTHKVQRLVDPQRGTAIRDVAQRVAHLRASAKDQEARATIREKLTSREARGQRFKYWYWHEVAAMDPADARTRAYVAQFDNGIYVPDGRFLPLGDNRDNSHDGRYYGPVRNDALFGRPLLRMWPLSRLGAIR
jgi:signal peptidase I